jgi:transposase-like protein
MSIGLRRRFGRAFKLELVRRMEAGESGTALAREFGIKPTSLYRWRYAVRLGGEEALRDGPGRPNRLEARSMELARGPAARASDLAEARRQIAALERKVGQQQVDLDFFEQALRRIEASPRPSDGPGVTASSPRSRR